MSIIKDLMTESDGVTHDVFRYLAVLSIVVGLFLAVYSVVKKDQPFDMQSFGAGVGLLLAGAGVALGLKKESKE